jgi:hypothetical protein
LPSSVFPVKKINSLAGGGNMRPAIVRFVVVLCLGAAFGGAGQVARAEPATVAASSPVSMTLQETCTPTTFRPDEWVVVDCLTRITNESGVSVYGVYAAVDRYEGSIPSYYMMWLKSRDTGQYVQEEPTALTFPPVGLGPGEVSESETEILFKMPQGTFTYELGVHANDETVTSQTVTLHAEPGAADPPTSVLVAEPVFSIGADGTSGVFEMRIANQGTSTISDLTVTDRLPDGILVSREPKPAAQFPSVNLMQCDLASFGKTSVAPGESLLLKMRHGPQGETGCGSVSFGLVVRATVDGQERLYGRGVSQSWGDCAEGGQGGGGPPVGAPTGAEQGIGASPATGGSGTQVVTPPRSGDGSGSATTGLGALIEALAVTGVLLTLLGHAAARGVRY